MRIHAPLTALLVGAALGCSERAPEPTPAEEPPPREGVFGQAPPAVGGIPSVVVLEAPTPPEFTPPERPPTIDQLGLMFSPTHLLLRPGQTFAVTNSESLGHNVHIRAADADSTVVNVDTDPSQRIELELDSEGAYMVGCDVHPGMRAVIYVTDSPYAAFASEDGRFVVPDVPPGTYTLHVWSADPELRGEHTVEVAGRSTEVTLASS